MIISAASDYRAAAQRILPPFLVWGILTYSIKQHENHG